MLAIQSKERVVRVIILQVRKTLPPSPSGHHREHNLGLGHHHGQELQLLQEMRLKL
jgi:hypothetical protein